MAESRESVRRSVATPEVLREEDSSKVVATTEVSKMKYLSKLVATTKVSSREYLSELVATTEAPLRMDDSSELIVAITKATIEGMIEATIKAMTEVSSEFLGMDWSESYIVPAIPAESDYLPLASFFCIGNKDYVVIYDKPLDLSRFHALTEKFDAITEESHLYGLKSNLDNKLKGLSNVKKIVSCYRAGNILSTPSDNVDLSRPVASQSAAILRIFDILRRFFFPLSFLSALVPKEEGKTLEIEEAVFYSFSQPVPSQLEYHGKPKANLVVKKLKIISYDPKQSAINCLVTKLVNGKIEHQENNTVLTLSSLSPMEDFIAFLGELSNILCLEQMEYISPHIMFGNCGFGHQPKEIYKDWNGDHTLIAVLGNGYNPDLFSKSDKKMTLPVIDGWSFGPVNAPVKNKKEGYTLPWLIHEYTKTSEFIICRTTDDYGFIANNVKESPSSSSSSQSYPIKCPGGGGRGGRGRGDGGGGGRGRGDGGGGGGERRLGLEEEGGGGGGPGGGGGGGGGGEGGGGDGGGGGGGDRGGEDRGGDRLGATAKAIRWLRERWSERYSEDYDNLIVLIPYGGVYKEDEMIEITEATDEGIIIVCAAGDCGVDPEEVRCNLKGNRLSKQLWGRLIMNQPIEHNTQEMPQEINGGNVVFPAALGIGISVGVAETGPKGREIDVSVNMHDPPVVSKDYEFITSNCGKAAARIASLLSLLLCRINDILRNDRLSPAAKKVVQYIKKRNSEEDIPPCHYINTYIIRELLVNERNGSHDPQLGYGDGEEIITSLLCMEDAAILQKLANIIVKKHIEIEQGDSSPQYQPIAVTPTIRNEKFYKFEGNGVEIAVIDHFGDDTEKLQGSAFRPFTTLKNPHGNQCAFIVQTVCPKSKVLCVNMEQETASHEANAFQSCSEKEDLSIICCSVSCHCYNYELCEAVNKAVMKGKIIVVSAANYGQSRANTIGYPGRIGNIIVVGGRDRYHNRVGFSSVGREIDFLAEALQFGGGTSYAAPVVAGYTALLLQFIEKTYEYDDTITAWSKSDGTYCWCQISIKKAAENVYAMRTLLKLLIPKSQGTDVHSEKTGFGCLDFTELFPYYDELCTPFVKEEAKKKIKETLEFFYKHP